MILKKITDCHVHLRNSPMTQNITKFSSERCSNIIVMPNTNPPIHDTLSIVNYREFYQELCNCKVHLTCKLLPRTTTEDIEISAKAGVVGWKLYPASVTTNSNDGISEEWLDRPPKNFIDVIQSISDNNLVLLHHGEWPNTYVIDREKKYLNFFIWVVTRFPLLRTTLEHISTKEGVICVSDLYRVGYKGVRGTITLHHLQKNLNDLLGDKLNPHLFCKPILKSSVDQNALVDAIKHPAFMFGSDSAPHFKVAKYEGCAGIFSSPVMLESLYEFMLDKLLDNYWDQFCWKRANEFYGFGENENIEIQAEAWEVPNDINGIVPYLANQELQWKIK